MEPILILNPETVDSYRTILSAPDKYNFGFSTLDQCFEECNKVMAKHTLYDHFIQYVKVPVPKVIFYILLDEIYGPCHGLDTDGSAGYRLKLKSALIAKTLLA